MVLRSIELTNFRSHPKRKVDFDEITAIVGQNGTGKTNILEAIWYLATTRPFRTHTDHEVIRWEQDGARIAGDSFEIRLARQPQFQKALFIDGIKRRSVEYLGELRAVLFTPDSTKIVTGSPADRRKFLDILLSQRNRLAAKNLVTYRNILTQRNALLRQANFQAVNNEVMEIWEDKLVDLGGQIIKARKDLIEELLPKIQRYYAQLSSEGSDAVYIEYRSTAPDNKEEYLKVLAKNRHREIGAQTTLFGPHRDDIIFTLRGHSADEHASRGEIRSIVLALKWAECELVSDEDHKPLLLLDDLFSELDENHRVALEDLMKTTQTVCTMTEIEHVPVGMREKIKVVKMES